MGELYTNEKDGKLHLRMPAGGVGGGSTGIFDRLATDEDRASGIHTVFKAPLELRDVDNIALQGHVADLNAALAEANAKLTDLKHPTVAVPPPPPESKAPVVAADPLDPFAEAARTKPAVADDAADVGDAADLAPHVRSHHKQK